MDLSILPFLMGTPAAYQLPLLLWALMLGAGCIPSRRGMGLVALPTPGAASMVGSVRATASPSSPPPLPSAPARAKSAPAPEAGGEKVVPISPLPAPAAYAERATAYVRMNGDACEAELRHRGIPHTSAAPAHGVDRPIRLTGPLHGVEIHEPGSPASWHRSVNEILDCRLALALDDFAALLAERDIVEVIHVSFYRKNARIAGRGTPSQHASGRALDLSVLVKRDGSRLDILQDWHGAIGDKVCGPDAAPPRQDTSGARELRNLVCEAASRGIFHLILTPNFNQAHSNHLHLDLTPNRTHADVK
ncbi:MAG: extensin family protein [Myxococcales bacterium]|nr:extensin family protein [Polyangiaceae bacterium]MDW8249123.1 extensin family protein [Myxococcales bacterium]